MKIEINMSIKGIAHVWGALAVGFLAVRCAATPTREWHKTSPRDIVDSFYRPGQYERPETVAALRELGASLYDSRAKAPGTNLRKGNDVPTAHRHHPSR